MAAGEHTCQPFKETPPHQTTASVLSKGESQRPTALGMACFLGETWRGILVSPFREHSVFSRFDEYQVTPVVWMCVLLDLRMFSVLVNSLTFGLE